MKEFEKKLISTSAKENLAYIKAVLAQNGDIVFREFSFDGRNAVIIYIDGMADKLLLDEYVIQPLMQHEDDKISSEEVFNTVVTASDVRKVDDMTKGINAFLSGDTLMFIDNLTEAYVIATRSWPNRGVGQAENEATIKGSKEGFTETIRFNTALVRRRIRDTRFKLIPYVFGERSKSDACIMYIDDIVNKKALKLLQKRLANIDIDAILDSSYIEHLIEDNINSPFPQIQMTERPDVVAAALYEGRIALIVDNSPYAIIVPATLPNFFQSPDDYYERWLNSSLVRLVRFMAILISLAMPALYVAITSYHSAIIPTKLAYSIAASREGVPFPAFLEVMIMEFSMAILLEAIVRLPKAIGATIGIVGGLIIGQSAVSAGLVSPIMIIVISLTTITTFITPNYDVVTALRLCRIFLVIASSILGLYGLMMGLMLILIHLIKLESFGTAYLAPMVNPNIRDFKDMYIKLPLKYFKDRPKYMKTPDKYRQK